MSTIKKDISNNIIKDVNISRKDSIEILDSILELIKDNGKSKNVKISGFGSFTYKRTPAREGRNPKNNEFFEIKSFKRLIFKPSNILKKNIN
jgi:integration host factor subunit alpha